MARNNPNTDGVLLKLVTLRGHIYYAQVRIVDPPASAHLQAALELVSQLEDHFAFALASDPAPAPAGPAEQIKGVM
ncbi:MAG TPA: hypothetical protein VIP46_22150 [Pyrinomonadaceae bacterium]